MLRASSSWPRMPSWSSSVLEPVGPKNVTMARTCGSSEKVSTANSMARSPRSK